MSLYSQLHAGNHTRSKFELEVMFFLLLNVDGLWPSMQVKIISLMLYSSYYRFHP